MKITWFLALLGAFLLIALLVLLELGILKSPFAAGGKSGSAAYSTPVASKFVNSLSPTATTDSTKQPNSRRQALYKLTQQGLVAKNELTALVKTPIPVFEHLENPHSAGAHQQREEIALRVTALEALDKLSIENPAEIQQALEEIAKIQHEPTLKFLIGVSLEGIYNKRPGKLTRTMDAMIQEKEKL